MEPKFAEILCLREVLKWLKELQISQVIVETDSLIAVKAILSRDEGISYFYSLAKDCRDLLQFLSNIALTFVPREANQFAHFISRNAIHVDEYAVWGGPFDLGLSSILCNIADFTSE